MERNFKNIVREEEPKLATMQNSLQIEKYRQVRRDYLLVLNELSSLKLDVYVLQQKWRDNQQRLKDRREKNSRFEKRLLRLENEKLTEITNYEDELEGRAATAKDELKLLRYRRLSLRTYLDKFNEKYWEELQKSKRQSVQKKIII